MWQTTCIASNYKYNQIWGMHIVLCNLVITCVLKAIRQKIFSVTFIWDSLREICLSALVYIFSCFFYYLQVYVEFDDQEWEKREWVKVYEDFQLFLLEYQLVWAKKKEGPEVGGACGGRGGMIQGTKAKHIQWPALVRVVYLVSCISCVLFFPIDFQ